MRWELSRTRLMTDGNVAEPILAARRRGARGQCGGGAILSIASMPPAPPHVPRELESKGRGGRRAAERRMPPRFRALWAFGAAPGGG